MTTILVVDDDEAILTMLTGVLQDEGYATMQAQNGIEALQLLGWSPVDLVIADIMMPVMSGRVLCEIMADDPKLKAIPLIMLSASGYRSIVKGLPHAGFLSKPVNIDDLYRMVAELLAVQYKSS